MSGVLELDPMALVEFGYAGSLLGLKAAEWKDTFEIAIDEYQLADWSGDIASRCDLVSSGMEELWGLASEKALAVAEAAGSGFEVQQFIDTHQGPSLAFQLGKMAGDFMDATLLALAGEGDDADKPEIPQIGAENMEIPPGSEVVTFDIPVWPGHGVTRVQYFIKDKDVCLSGVGPDIMCGYGDDRAVVNGHEVTDYNMPARVRIVFDHEAGKATLVAYPTHMPGEEVPALPVDLSFPKNYDPLPDDYPSEVRVYREGEGIDGNIVFDYRFLNSVTPEWAAGAAPAIMGNMRIRQGPHGTVKIEGNLAQYPTVEIIRDVQLPNGYQSNLIFVKDQESGGPLNLFEPWEKFGVVG